jgi:hypothetical protein
MDKIITTATMVQIIQTTITLLVPFHPPEIIMYRRKNSLTDYINHLLITKRNRYSIFYLNLIYAYYLKF